MNERIKKIRKEKKLTQQKFADMLKTSRNNIAGYEAGSRMPSDAAINNICITFNVNENWLRTGSGEMFKTIDSEVSTCIEELLSEENPLFDVIKSIMITYKKLDADSRDIVDGFISRSLEELKSTTLNNNDDAPYIPDTPEELEAMCPPIEDNQKNKDVG